MPVAFIQEWRIDGDDRSTTNYDTVSERLDVRENPPEGAILHTAGFDEDNGVFRIFEVWESREACDRFMRERLMPIIEELSAGQPEMTPPDRQGLYELHGFMNV